MPSIMLPFVYIWDPVLDYYVGLYFAPCIIRAFQVAVKFQLLNETKIGIISNKVHTIEDGVILAILHAVQSLACLASYRAHYTGIPFTSEEAEDTFCKYFELLTIMLAPLTRDFLIKDFDYNNNRLCEWLKEELRTGSVKGWDYFLYVTPISSIRFGLVTSSNNVNDYLKINVYPPPLPIPVTGMPDSRAAVICYGLHQPPSTPPVGAPLGYIDCRTLEIVERLLSNMVSKLSDSDNQVCNDLAALITACRGDSIGNRSFLFYLAYGARSAPLTNSILSRLIYDMKKEFQMLIELIM